MKKTVSLALALTLVLTLLAGCAGQPAVQQPAESTLPAEAPATPPAETPADAAAPVKTGLAVIADVGKSKPASAEGDGQAQANISLVAVTVGDDGVIDACVIDMVQAKVGFSAAGLLTTDASTTFQSKNELGEGYGMKKASSIGKEWNEQAAAMADYVVGKTLEEVKGIAVAEDGKAADADLAASVTVSVGGFISGIEAAVSNAEHLGAVQGDSLKLTSVTNIAKSKDASADAEGQAQAYATVAALTFNGDAISSCAIDAVQATVKFNASGAITTDLAAAQPTKQELGDGYGMKKASSIGKEWFEQADAFARYVTGKTAAEVAGISVTDAGKAGDADLAASVTVGIGDFVELIAKAAQ